MDKNKSPLDIYFDYALSILIDLREQNLLITNVQIISYRENGYRLLIECAAPPSPSPSTSATNEPPRDGAGG